MNDLKFIIISLACSIVVASYLVKARINNIESIDNQIRLDATIRDDMRMFLDDQRNRVEVNGTGLKAAFSQIYFGGSIHKLSHNQIKVYEKMMSGMAKNLTQSNVSIKCTWISQGNLRTRKWRKEERRKKRKRNNFQRYLERLNYNLPIRNLAECSVERNVSLTINFLLEWNSTSDENIMHYFDEYMIFMNSFEGKLKIASHLRDMNVCAMSARTLKTIPIPTTISQHSMSNKPSFFQSSSPSSCPSNLPTETPSVSPSHKPSMPPTSIASELFNQTYRGPSSLLNSTQLKAYESYFASLTEKYTNETIQAKCTVTEQEINVIYRNGDSRRLSGQSKYKLVDYVIRYDYKLPWEPETPTIRPSSRPITAPTSTFYPSETHSLSRGPSPIKTFHPSPDPITQVSYEIQVSYILTLAWNPKTSNKYTGEDLFANYTNYINNEESVNDIKDFMNLVGVPVEDIDPAETTKNMTLKEAEEGSNYTIASGQFIEYYYGPESFSILDQAQVKEYETYFENLTKHYTDLNVTANCTIIGQRKSTDEDSKSSRRLSDKIGGVTIVFMMSHAELVTKGYDETKIAINDRALQTIDDIDISKELIANFTNYINKNQTVKEIEEFMNTELLDLEAPVHKYAIEEDYGYSKLSISKYSYYMKDIWDSFIVD